MKAAFKYGGVGLVGLAFLVASTLPWEIGGSLARSSIEKQVERSTGFRARIEGGVALKLFPRPRLQLAQVVLSDRSGGFTLDAPSVRGNVDVPRLLRGEVLLVSARILEPTIVVDLDRAQEVLARLADPVRGAETSGRPAFKLSARNAVVRTLSGSPQADTVLTNVDLDADQAQHGGRLTVTGSFGWHATTTQFAGSIERVASLFDGERSGATLQVQSVLGSISASGVLSGTTDRQFVGHLGASSNALPHLWEIMGAAAPGFGIRRTVLTTDALVKPGQISLSSLQLRLDQMQLEGTLAVRGGGARRLIEATLASDRLDLNALLGDLTSPQSLGDWYRTSIDRGALPADVDLRISAGAARVGGVDVHDAALSAMFRNDRLEVTLDEARAYEGLIRARALATFNGAGWDAHADASVSDVELGPATDAVSGEERATGALSAHVVVDGHGGSANDVVRSLGGQGQASVRNGNFRGLSLQQALRRYGRKMPLGAKLPGEVTAFDSASSTFAIKGGVATITDGRVVGPGMLVSFGGKTDLPRGEVDIRAVATRTDGRGSVTSDAPRLPFAVHGTWGTPLAVVRSGAGGLTGSGELPGFGAGVFVP